jgi:hypothetical protein
MMNRYGKKKQKHQARYAAKKRETATSQTNPCLACHPCRLEKKLKQGENMHNLCMSV